MKLEKLLFGLAAAFLAASCVAPFPVSAAYTGNTVTLTTAQTVALFGSTIDCTYYAAGANGTVIESDATFSYIRNETIQYENLYSENGQTFAGRQTVTYQLNTSDITVRPTEATIKLKTSIDLSGVQYIDTGICEWLWNISTGSAGSWFIPQPLLDALYGSYNDYWHTSEDTFFPLRRGASGSNDFNYYGAVRSSYSYAAGAIIPCYLNVDSLTGFSFGFANCNWAAWTAPNNSGKVFISIVCPILSDNWQYTGNQGAGDYDPNASSGGGSDGGGTDLSGVHSRLDDIIALLDEIADNTAGDGSSSSANSSDQSGVAADNSRVQQEINSAVSEQSYIDQVMNADSIVLPEMENSYEVDASFKQFFEFTDSGGTVHQTPIFAMMILGITIAALSYILFGKGF